VPFRSRAQQAYLFIHHPDVARRFAKDTPSSAYPKLPEHVKKHPVIEEMKKRSRGHHH
jgi:hypothetical protein